MNVKPIAFAFILCCLIPCGVKAQTRSGLPKTIDDPPDPPPAWVPLGLPPSTRLYGIEFDRSTRRTEATGSDIWPVTWANNGHQYAAFGDGGGFGGSNQLGRVSMGVARIEGDLQNYQGINVWGGRNAENPAFFEENPAFGKGTGIISVAGKLYLWVGRPKLLGETGLAVSHDHGAHWELASWHWTIHDRVCAGTFLNCGQDNSAATDDFVYACFTRVVTPPFEDRGWFYERPGHVDLARAPKDRILEQSQWQWFTGFNQLGVPIWTDLIQERQPILVDPNGVKIVYACYQPAMQVYLMTYSPRDNAGNFALLEAEQPWGPWHTVAYLKDEPLFSPPAPNARVTTFQFSPKWWSHNGFEFGLIFNVGDDAWNTVRGRLMVKNLSENR